MIGGVQLQFIKYPYRLLQKLTGWGNIKISSVEDIACTKLQTIGSRGGKKDFVDLFYILKHYSLQELFKMLKKKYLKSDFSEVHILKSLIYFDKADKEPMPRLKGDDKWEEMKREIIETVKSFGLEE